MKILSIDIGTRMGYASLLDGEIQYYSHVDMTGNFLRPETKSWKYADVDIGGVFMETDPQVVVVEHVHRWMSNAAATRYCGLRTLIAMWCDEYDAEMFSITPGEWKKLTVGKGNATKDDVKRWCIEQGYAPKNQDEADAICTGIGYYRKEME